MSSKRTLAVITGASKGFGRAIAHELASYEAFQPLHMVLVARSKGALEATQAEVLEKTPETMTTIIQADLTGTGSVEQLMHEMGPVASSCELERGLLFCNAGTLGELAPVEQLSDPEGIQSSADLNLTNFMWTVSKFSQWWKQTAPDCRLDIVNISSLAAVEAMPSFGVYCAVKAARDMYLQVAAKDFHASGLKIYEKVTYRLQTLNYAPGPMETSMQQTIRSAGRLNDDMKRMFNNLKEQEHLVDVFASARKMLFIVEHDKFTSGQHIDYFDELP